VTIWGLAAGLYGLVLAGAAVSRPIKRRHVAVAASAAYALVGLGLGTLAGSFWINLLAPGGLLLTGYWLSGFFSADPQPWLEQWLLAIDRRVRAERWMHAMPRAVAEVLEGIYAADYAVIGGGAIYAATAGTDAVAHYWSLVLAAELASFAAMPWLRSRPPRAIEREHDQKLRRLQPRAPCLRRLNTAILDHASVQANTLPSGHVSGAVGAAFGVMAFDPVTGSALMIAASLIGVAAVAGRYHYVVDCVAAAVVAIAFRYVL
jgi:hypothetical protein